MTLPPLTYLTTDSVIEGVGSSQVLAYAAQFAERGLVVRLHSFEKTPPSTKMVQSVLDLNIEWTAHPFGNHGPAGGLQRVMTGARAVRGAELVHARSDLPAASALLSRRPTWVWDVRSLWADQRIALGALRAESPEHKVLQRIERSAARRSAAVVTLTEAVLPVLDARYGRSVSEKALVVPTCVDLIRFPFTPMPAAHPLHLLLAGTLNTYYDVPTMLRLVQVGQSRGRAALDVIAPAPTRWDGALGSAGARVSAARPEDMPARIASSHVGLSVCRSDAGVSLTAAMPTKVAEFLATGRPVVVSAGLGDADRLVESSRTGVVLRDLSDTGLEAAWDQLEALVADPGTAQRCRALAEAHFDLTRGVDRLMTVYERVSQRV